MPNLVAIREQRAAAVAKARAIIAKAETENRQLTAEESKDFDAIKAEITNLEAQEHRAQFIDDAERRSVARPVDGGRDTLETLEQRASLLSVIRAGTEGRSLTGADAELHAELERRQHRQHEHQQRADDLRHLVLRHRLTPQTIPSRLPAVARRQPPPYPRWL